MDTDEITLGILVKSGNAYAVQQFGVEKRMEPQTTIEKMTEAFIYLAIKRMWEQAEGGIDAVMIVPFLGKEQFVPYFEKTRNLPLLHDLVDVLYAGTDAEMEAYAQISSYDVLGVPSVSKALRNNLDDPGLKEKMVKLVKKGYSLAFCPHDIDAEMLEEYFPIIDSWRDLVDSGSIVEVQLEDMAEFREFDDEDEDIAYFTRVLGKLIEMTNREFVSGVAQERFWPKLYSKLAKQGVLDDIAVKRETESAIENAIHTYERQSLCWDKDVDAFEKALHGKGKAEVGARMGLWFTQGRMDHLRQVYGRPVLYDVEVARKAIAESLVNAIESWNTDVLGLALELPETLLDKTDPRIYGVVEAYRLYKDSKGLPQE